MADNDPKFDPSLTNPGNYWKMLSSRPVSVPVVAAEDGSGPAGFLALSVSHVSSTPPAMSVAVGKSTRALATIVRSGCFAISYLPEGATGIADIFGGRGTLDGADRFQGGDWQRLTTGAPVFNRAVLMIDCLLDKTFEYYDTVILIGLIQQHVVNSKQSTLMSYGGTYRAWEHGKRVPSQLAK